MTVLSHRELSPRDVLERIAVPSDQASSGVVDGVEQGSVTVSGRPITEFERNDIIEHDGDFYRLSTRSGIGSSPEILVIRFGRFVVGVLAVLLAWVWRG